MLWSLVVDDGLFQLALWGSVLLDGRLFDGVGWCMLVLLWIVGVLVDLNVVLMVVMTSLVGGPLDGWI